ncbi:MAG: thiamine diphosphokinase [Firmicutes bacterium]|nr:thiamine diphosphokinase [Bacillota bacterium]
MRYSQRDKVCYIIGAGPCEALCVGEEKEADDYVIAADGGLRHLEEAGLTADMVVGDFDTLGYIPQHDHIIQLQTAKDETDTFVAMREAMKLGYRQFLFYGCLDGKIEHTMANLQLLAWLAERGCRGWLIGESQVITSLAGPAELRFSPIPDGQKLSIFAHSDRAEGVALKGLKFPLSEATLDNRFPLGVSNEFTGEAASIHVKRGTLLVVLPRKIWSHKSNVITL